MKKQTRKNVLPANGYIPAPGYPFSARAIFGDLRAGLAAEHKYQISYERLSMIFGVSKSTTYHWFNFTTHAHLLGFFSLLERLSPASRQAFINGHCRTCPSLDHLQMTVTTGTTISLAELLELMTGLTIITGGAESSRTFVITALGHAAIRGRGMQRAASGIDLHRPIRFVPVESFTYIDGSVAPDKLRGLVHKIWARILTSTAPRLFFNGVWSSLPELREDLIRQVGLKHVFITAPAVPDMHTMRPLASKPIHVLTITSSRAPLEGIGLTCRRVWPEDLSGELKS